MKPYYKSVPKVDLMLKSEQVEPTLYHILKKTSILLFLMGMLFFFIVFFVDFEWEKNIDWQIYTIFFFIYALSFLTVLLIIKQAIHQSSMQVGGQNNNNSITNEFRQGLALLPDSMYQLQRIKNGDIIFSYHEGKRADELGITTEKVKGKLVKDIVTKEIFETIILPLERAFSGNVVEFQLRTETHVYEHTIKPLFDPITNEIIEVSGYGVDITVKELTEKRMKSLTDYDQLTGLFNREKYSQMVERLIKNDNEYKQISLLLIDLDDFKHVNDTLGHSVGDQLLIQAANRLKHLFFPDQFLFRLGGDEFAVLFTSSISREDITKNAQKIITTIREPIYVGDHQLFTSASIGLAIYPEHANDAKTLLKHADLAMYRAKNEGKNFFSIYSKDLMMLTIQKIEIQKALRVAIEKNEFSLYYQPQIDVYNQQVVGVEALIRWFHPKKGFISPLDFIPIAEETGMIQEIGKWVIQTACEQSRSWREQGVGVPVSVNLSAKQFRQTNLVEMIQEIMDETDMDPSCLNIEITESTSMHDVEYTINLLQEIQSKGIKISIDDFGTGYSSLSYLQKLPINCLKIDRSFVQAIESSTNGIALVKTIIDLAQNLNFSVIAEGVETVEQRDLLASLGCHNIQGYLYSPPIHPHEVIHFVNKPTELQKG